MQDMDMFYISVLSVTAVSSSPFFGNLRSKGLEVLYIVDFGYQCVVQQLKEFMKII